MSEADTDADEDYEVSGVAARGEAEGAQGTTHNDETGADGEAGAGAATDWRERARRARGAQRKREAKRRRDAGPPMTRGSVT